MSDPTRRAVAAAGHTGNLTVAELGLESHDPAVRATALGALERLGALSDRALAARLADDPSPAVRRRAAEIAAVHPDVDLLAALQRPRRRRWSRWRRGRAANTSRAATTIVDPADRTRRRSRPTRWCAKLRVAALGAIGDERGVDAIIAATTDKPAVRRRAVLALPRSTATAVEAAIERALTDRDWQVRQAAEDLRRAER